MSDKGKKGVVVRNGTAEFLTFSYQSNGEGVEVRVQDGTVWLMQKHIGTLFDTTPHNVMIHLKNIFEQSELAEAATCKEFLQVQTEGDCSVSRSIKHYNLDVIIAVGYRVNSERARNSDAGQRLCCAILL
jgi:hypothetical protein